MIRNGQPAVPFRKTRLGKSIHLVKQKGLRLRKEIYQWCCFRRSSPKQVLLIFGCQRSGTTLMGNVFAKDLRTAVLQEMSCITGNHTLRLRPCPEVNRILSSFRAPLVVAKPIVEGQRAPELLAEISGAKAIWMFRDFHDVVRSNVQRFHSQIDGLRMASTGTPPSWRNENISESTQSILRHYYSEDMPRADAAALGWYSRNILFFELGLDRHDSAMLCKYEDFVSRPDEVMAGIYQHVGMNYPRSRITGDVDRQSLGHGRQADLNENIAALCSELLELLEEHYRKQCRRTAGSDKNAMHSVY